MEQNRTNAVLAYLKSRGGATVGELCKALFVSEATVRRELAKMQSLGLIERTRGGAVIAEHAEEISILLRARRNVREKELVATAALSVLPDFKTVFIDSSTTALALAMRMELAHKSVVTNSLHTASMLSKKQGVSVILLGGELHADTDSVTGSYTVEALRQMRFDLMLGSAASVVDGVAYETSLEQAAIKRVALQNSKHRILLIDHTKLNSRGTYQTSALSQFDFVACDRAVEMPESVRLVY